MRVLDLFSGIGGFSLGLERAGMETVAFCEFDEHARNVLKKHWPKKPIFNDIRELTADAITAAGIDRVDVIAGGFPCQDISVAGKQAGLSGERSGLWSEYARLIGEIKPAFAIIENVAALRSNGLETVLSDLWALGYDAEWHIIPASSVGLPHQRERLWIIAYPSGQGLEEPVLNSIPDALGTSTEKPRFSDGWICERVAGWVRGESVLLGNGVSGRLASSAVRQYGNAVVPQIPEIIGKAIMKASKALGGI